MGPWNFQMICSEFGGISIKIIDMIQRHICHFERQWKASKRASQRNILSKWQWIAMKETSCRTEFRFIKMMNNKLKYEFSRKCTAYIPFIILSVCGCFVRFNTAFCVIKDKLITNVVKCTQSLTHSNLGIMYVYSKNVCKPLNNGAWGRGKGKGIPSNFKSIAKTDWMKNGQNDPYIFYAH